MSVEQILRIQHWRDERADGPTTPTMIEVLVRKALESGDAQRYLKARLDDAVLGPLAMTVLEDVNGH